MDLGATHRYAKTAEGLWVHTRDAEKGMQYFCGCPDGHRLKFVKASGREDKRHFESYFAHVSDKVHCRGGGESEEHKEAKHILRERFGQYSFAISCCPCCNKKNLWEQPLDARVELEVVSDDKRWRYDCMVVVNGQKQMALEVYHTHKTGEIKTQKTREDGLQIAEFNASDVIKMGEGKNILENFLCKSIECNACTIRNEKIKRENIARQKANEEAMRLEIASKQRKEQMVADRYECFRAWNEERLAVSSRDSDNYYIWSHKRDRNNTTDNKNTERSFCSTAPLPVPSEAFDFTPPELWRILHEEYPHGVELPASVPKKIWDAHWESRNPELARSMRPPPPPPFIKCYWGKLRGRALQGRKRKAGEADEPLPPVWPPQLSKRFWARYFQTFPDGHRAPPSEPYAPFRQGEDEPKKYALMKGSLHVNVGSQERPFWRPSTGVDAWDKQGTWLGPG